MFQIKVSGQGKSNHTCKASRISSGEVFSDPDGDLYLRLPKGCLAISREDIELDCIVQYPESELEDFNDFPFFEHCRKVECSVTISVNI